MLLKSSLNLHVLLSCVAADQKQTLMFVTILIFAFLKGSLECV